MYEGWEKDAERARENFRVLVRLQDGKARRDNAEIAAEFADGWLTRYVEAQASTGSRYAVVVTQMGLAAGREGGPVLVTVLSPWQDAWCLAADGYLDMSYVAEHLTAGRGRGGNLHGGDLKALTMTIQHALGREEEKDV